MKRLSSDHKRTIKSSRTKLNKIGKYILLYICHISRMLCHVLACFFWRLSSQCSFDEKMFEEGGRLLPQDWASNNCSSAAVESQLLLR